MTLKISLPGIILSLFGLIYLINILLKSNNKEIINSLERERMFVNVNVDILLSCCYI